VARATASVINRSEQDCNNAPDDAESIHLEAETIEDPCYVYQQSTRKLIENDRAENEAKLCKSAQQSNEMKRAEKASEQIAVRQLSGIPDSSHHIKQFDGGSKQSDIGVPQYYAGLKLLEVEEDGIGDVDCESQASFHDDDCSQLNSETSFTDKNIVSRRDCEDRHLESATSSTRTNPSVDKEAVLRAEDDVDGDGQLVEEYQTLQSSENDDMHDKTPSMFSLGTDGSDSVQVEHDAMDNY
jgi:hypothetical protein